MNSQEIAARRSSPEARRALSTIYRDPNNFFVAVIPEGWQSVPLLQGIVGSKVQFLPPPAAKGGSIEVIASPSLREFPSLDDVVSEQEKRVQLFKRLYPDASVTTQRRKVLDKHALIQRVVGTKINIENVLFVEGNTLYQLSLYAASNKAHEQLADTFQRFLNAFTILQPGRTFTDADRVRSVVDRAKYMAQRFTQVGETRMALELILDALRVDPSNEELLDLKAKLTNEQKKD
jgi:hypothetical protein